MSVRKRVILIISAALSLCFAVCTIVAAYRYNASIPVIETVRPTINPDTADDPNNIELRLPIQCQKDFGSIYLVKERDGLFSKELYVQQKPEISILRTDDKYIYFKVGIIWTEDEVLLSSSLPIRDGSVVKLE